MKQPHFKIVLALVAFNAAAARVLNIPHLDLEMTGPEYRVLLDRSPEVRGGADDPLRKLLDLGKRNLDWVETINRARDPSRKLQLSTAATQVGVPMDQPRESNREIVQAAFEKFTHESPASFVNVLLAGDSRLPSQVPADLDDETFLARARAMDRIYQSAGRWLLEEPNLDYYVSRASTDVRGYYFLSQEHDLAERLSRWNTLDTDTKTQWAEWLVGECRNSGNGGADCKDEFAKARTSDANVLAFHRAYVEVAGRTYADYFRIPSHRRDIDWNASHSDSLIIPFQEPASLEIKDWLRGNIEDEWRWLNWNLRLNFSPDAPSTARVVFQPGVTPHVNGLAGSIITMDSNPALSEYLTTWTIRHEFGHVLGFPDCYVEFFDEDKQVMVNYQLDVTNLMCSRRGKLQQKHFDELKRVYYR